MIMAFEELHEFQGLTMDSDLMVFKEFEIKLSTNNRIEQIKKRLFEFGFMQTKDVIQEDYYFDIGIKLFEKDERLRIRFEYTAPYKLNYCQWTWKGPRPTQNTDVREDHSIDIPVDQAKDLQILLEKLGFEVLVAFRKVRTRYKLDDSEIEIEFDEQVTLLHESKEIPMGSFLQVSLESELPENTNIKELDKKLWDDYVIQLGFSGKDRINKTYVEIALELSKREK